MPSADQLANLPVATDGDGSTSQTNDDGSTSTSFADGTTRVDDADGSCIITFTDGAVLNQYADGSRTLNDKFGTALDPSTGQPADPGSTPTQDKFGPDAVLNVLEGGEELKGLVEAKELYDAAKESIAGEINPLTLIVTVFKMVLAVVKALETEERGCRMRAWCYQVLYGALDMGAVPEPTFAGSLGGADQDSLDQQAWRDGIAQGTTDLANGTAGTTGTALRNKVLLRVAADGSDPSVTVTALWQAACQNTEDDQLARAYETPVLARPTGA